MQLFKEILLILALISISIIFSAHPAQAEDLVIVGPDGYSQLQEAIDAVSAGGTISIQAGQYQVPRLIINKSITIRGGGGATLLAAEDTTSSGVTNSWIRVESGCQAEFEGLCLDGNGKKILNALYGAGTLLVTNCSFANIQYPLNKGRAILLIGDNSVVDGCSFSHIGRAGIYIVGSKNVLLENNTYTGKGTGNYLDYGIEVASGAQVTIRGSLIRGCSGLLTSDGIYSAAILISTENTSYPCSVIIEDQNVIRDNLYGVLIGLLGNDNSHVQIRGNIIADNQSAAIASYSREISAEQNYWGETGPALQGSNNVPAWLDTCPWAAAAADENGDGIFDQLAYLVDLQWSDGSTDLQLATIEPGVTCTLSFTAHLNEIAPETTVTYVMEWTAADPDTLSGITINGTPITDTLQPGQQTTYQVDAVITTPGTYTIFLYALG